MLDVIPPVLSFPSHVQSEVQSRLEPAEQVLWSGSPRPDLMARRGWKISAFGAVWFGTCVYFLNSIGWFRTLSIDWPLPGILGLFALVGLGIMVGHPMLLARKAADIAYVITSKRAIILEVLPKGRPDVRWFEPNLMAKAEALVNKDGSGDLIFDVRLPRIGARPGDLEGFDQGFRRPALLGFFGISDVLTVETIAREAGERKLGRGVSSG